MSTTSQHVDQVLKELNEIEIKVGNRIFSRGELKEAFDLVCDKENWKLPINTTLPVKDIQALNTILVAVEFFTGSKASFEFDNFNEAGVACFHVKAIGYYNAVGA